jgi:uridine kinase
MIEAHYDNAVRAIEMEVRRRLAKVSPLLVALDGGSGAGKTRLATRLAEQIGASVVNTDDFWAGGDDEVWEARTVQERVELVIDWRRLRSEAVVPLLAQKTAQYLKADFVRNLGVSDEIVTIHPAEVIIIEGIYSCRPELADLVSLSVLVDVPLKTRHRGRIAREGTHDSAWHHLWDEPEEYYFSVVMPRSAFDMVINGR